MRPIFEYDPEKSKGNKEKHCLDLVEAQELWDVEHVVVPAQIVGDEIRYTILGKLANRLHMAVFTRRGFVIRLITFHKADRRLQREYERSINEKEKA